MRRFVLVFLLCAILVTLIAAQMRLCAEASRIIPNAVLLENPEGLGITVARYLSHDSLTISAAINEKGSVSSGSVTVAADLIYADSRYGGVFGLRMLNGAFFPDGDNTAAVISDELASKLYFSQDILGARLEINGVTFSVCGVYKKETSAAVRLSENGSEDIYLPLGAYSDKSAQIKTIYCRAAGGWFPASALDHAVSELGTPLNAIVLTDYSEINLLAAQSGRLLLFLLGVLAAGITAAVFFKQLAALCRDITAAARAYETPRERSAETVRRFAPYLLCGMAAVLILWVVSFDAYVPSGWLRGGISVEQFVERFISETQGLNASEYRFLDIYVRRVLIWLYTLDIVGFISGILLAIRVTKKRSDL